MNQLLQKIDSITYMVRAKLYSRSREWLSHRHNRDFPDTDWKTLHRDLAAECRRHDVPLLEMKIDANDFENFMDQFRLSPLSLYARGCREKKMMEHYVAFRLLDLKPGDRYIDIASENSPFPELARQQLGLKTYSQDLTYPPGFRGDRIGSSADRLPVNDSWVDGTSLQCAFEHFQGDIDTNFIRELARVLKPGGRCVVVPLYMGQKALNIYDPILYADWNDANADPDAEVIAEIALGGHFERVYAPSTLKRILVPGIGLYYRLYHVVDKEKVFPSISPGSLEQLARVRYALLVEKSRGS